MPDFVSVATHRCLEVNEFIMIWYHAEGEEPSWFPPEVEKLLTDYYRVGSWDCYLECHIQVRIYSNNVFKSGQSIHTIVQNVNRSYVYAIISLFPLVLIRCNTVYLTIPIYLCRHV